MSKTRGEVIKFISIRHKVIIKQDTPKKKKTSENFFPSLITQTLPPVVLVVGMKGKANDDDKIPFLHSPFLCVSTDTRFTQIIID